MDTLPASKYYRKGGYPCMTCTYGDNRTCKMCGFAVWNVEGIQGGFSPSEAYRRAHAKDVRDSPLIMKNLEDKSRPIKDMNGVPLIGLELGHPNNSVLPRDPNLPRVHLPYFPVGSKQSMINSLKRLQGVRKAIG